MTTPDYILRFAEAIAPGNAELLLTGGTEEAILNAATDTISDLRERNAELAAQRLEADDRAYYEGRIAELESQRDALLAACWAVALAITAQQQYDAYQLCVDAIAKAQGEVCSFCGGTGAVDSGAPSPQGYFIDVPCPECDGTGDPRQRKEVPNGV